MSTSLVWATPDPAVARILWHPAVHEYFGERCHYYLISAKRNEIAGSLSEDIRRLVNSLQIRSATVHAVYGSYDAVLRFWATSQSRQRFLRGLEQSRLQVQVIREFTASEAVYGTNRGASPSHEDIRLREAQIKDICRRQRDSDSAFLGQMEVDELTADNIVYVRAPAQGVKLFMFLKSMSDSDTQPSDFVVARIQQYCQENDLRAVSVYRGIGFADYIVKAVAPSYDDMLGKVNRLRRLAKSLHFDPWTLPVADYGLAEMGETIDAVEGDLPRDLEGLAEIPESEEVRQQLRREIGSMLADQRRALADLYARLRDSLTGADLERIDESVIATVLKSRKDLNRAASFLTSIEDDLRYFAPRFLARHLGDNWIRDLRLGLDRVWDGRRDPPDAIAKIQTKGPFDWSLGDFMFIMRFSMFNLDEPAQHELEQVFAFKWDWNYKPIVDLRDDFAHGKIMALVREGNFSGALGTKLEALAVASKFQTSLEKAIGEYQDK